MLIHCVLNYSVCACGYGITIVENSKKTAYLNNQIADFGLSQDLQNKDYYVSQGGKIPVKWTAPEALHYRKYSTASDVWSYGCLLYEIWSLGCKPFSTFTNVEVSWACIHFVLLLGTIIPVITMAMVHNLGIIQVVRKIGSGYRLPPPPGCPRAIYTIMIQCW